MTISLINITDLFLAVLLCLVTEGYFRKMYELVLTSHSFTYHIKINATTFKYEHHQENTINIISNWLAVLRFSYFLQLLQCQL